MPRPVEECAQLRAARDTAGRAVASAGVWPDVDHPAEPYPGAVPPVSYVHVGRDRARRSRDGAVDGLPLDAWLRAQGAAPLAGAAAGARLRLQPLPVEDHLAAADAGARRRPGGGAAGPHDRRRGGVGGRAARPRRRPARRARRGSRRGRGPRGVAGHARPDRRARPLRGPRRAVPAGPPAHRLGRGRRRRARRSRGRDTEVRVERPWVYLGHAEIRRPLLVDGAPVRCADVPQDVAGRSSASPRQSDGLDADPVIGAPHPDEWPDALFAYGLLQPGQISWRAGRTRTRRGRAADDGRGRRVRHRPRLPRLAARRARGRRRASSCRSATRPRCSPRSTPTRARSTSASGSVAGGDRVLGLRLARRPGGARRAARRWLGRAVRHAGLAVARTADSPP